MNKVLYIEDNEINRIVFKKLTEKHAEVDMASDGYEGLEKIRNNQFDIVYLDLNLNDENMDGFDVIRNMQEEGLINNGKPKLIAITAYASDEWKQKCFDAGFDDYMTKPISPLGMEKSVNSHTNSQLIALQK